MFPVELPTELIVFILSYLPLETISVLKRIDHEWHEFIALNASTVYRNAAWREGWIAFAGTTLQELDYPEEQQRRKSYYSRRAMHGVGGWKDFCHRRRMIERSWAGRAPSEILTSPRTMNAPLSPNRTPYLRAHRIKVDEKVGLVMTTSGVGGLVVRDLESDEVLWELPMWYVRSYAHLEYGEGFVIFDRDDGNKEVWRRTEDNVEPSTLVTSFPDARQIKMGERTSTLCARAQFTPYALFQMPGHTRAYRFVYPTLLVANLESAFLWDIRTGEMVQTLDGIQDVLPFGEGQESDAPAPPASTPDHHGMPEGESAGTSHASHHSDPGFEPAAAGNDTQHPPDQFDWIPDADLEDEEEGDLDFLPEFLGVVHYVELSERHVVIVGRYLLRVFSRGTGKPVLDLPSTMLRYGAVKWEVRSQKWAEEGGFKGKGKGKGVADDYTHAMREGREVVRMPLELTYEGYQRGRKLLVDQYVAAHISSDGKHLVALLSGSRIIVFHYFEALCNTISDLASTPRADIISRLAANSRQLPSVSVSSKPTPTTPNASLLSPEQVQRNLSPEELYEAGRHLTREKDRIIYNHTLDIQLGPPLSSLSIYLAYENGRIGVVTSNAVYIVTPDLPPPPHGSRVEHGRAQANIPRLRVARLPYFALPAALAAVSCLMMSDTGLYLNWNPSISPPPALPPAGHEKDVDAEQQAHALRMQPWLEWEREYELGLELYEHNTEDQYQVLPNGDMLVHNEMVFERSEMSTVYAVDFSVGDILPRSPI
ncbi:hypothetical protein HYPSUDRAFT_194203 [Hypholoma sublateritium FD-334 SS-4]|uniref:F-box domain-containing protein n=1 Tax=Hypholoma sublateritium (strain FD-334 SS-4) TaxID=945553 RepID=A0A0D2P507_HYPSF|nr:hypothetical protein HYPSUDRAFT_194203 [Hypholoma sublateritium FD-334 SS-4]